MRFHLKQDRFLIFFFACLAFVLVTLFGCLLLLKHLSHLQIQSDNQRYDTYRVATLLRRTSDDLTTMVRMYVMTGEKKYKDHFNEILSIRAGKSPRPERYDQIYWDFVLDGTRPRPFGPPESLNQLLTEQGVTLEEFQLLKEAENRSNALAQIEIKAMNAMEGKFEEGSTNEWKEGPPDPKFAQELVFGDEYMKIKAHIMEPIQRFFEVLEERTNKRTQELDHYVTLVIVLALSLSAVSTGVMVFSVIRTVRVISRGAQENELLLLNILPSAIVDRLKHGEDVIADEHPQASVLFSDIVGFTSMTSKIGTTKMVDILGHLFDEFDTLTTKYGVEKIKTIGDAYMAVSGVTDLAPDHAIRMADFALAMRDKVKEFGAAHQMDLQIRTGMTCGSVISGVIGHKKFIYDVWGDVVNTASRMESTGTPGEIQITEKMALLLEDAFVVEKAKEIEVKGKGLMQTYLLKSRKVVTQPS
jgi:adenylate cyclase